MSELIEIDGFEATLETVTDVVEVIELVEPGPAGPPGAGTTTAPTDSLDITLAGQAARLAGLRTDTGAALGNPFTGANLAAGIRLPTSRAVDLTNRTTDSAEQQWQLLRPAVAHFSAALTGTVPESFLYDVRVFAEITNPATATVQPDGTIEVTFSEAVSGVTCAGNGTGTLEATDGTSYAPSVSGTGAVYTLAAPVAGWVQGAVVTITISPTIAAVAAATQLYDGLGFLLDVATLTPDVTAPVMTGFVIEATSADATIAITTLTATDDRAVSAYQVNTSATPPAAGAGTWQSAAAWISAGYPSGLTAGQSQTITLYAWAKDAAGNVSASATDSCVVTIPANVASFTVQPTLTAALYDGGTFGFTVADSGSRNVDVEAWTGAAWVSKLTNVAAGAKTVTIDGLTAGSKAGLKFRVSPTGLAEWVESSVITTFDTVAPAFTSVTAGAVKTTSVFANHANDTAASFNLKWGTTTGQLTNTLTGVTSPYEHTPITAGQPYYYAVVAVKGGVESTASAERTATPTAASGLADAFIAADNTNVHGRTPDIGGVWAAYPYSGTSASVKVLSNKAQATEDAAGHIVAESNLSDYIYTGLFTTFDNTPSTAASTQGFVLNYIDESNYIYIMLAVGNAGTRGIIGYHLVAGVATSITGLSYLGFNYATEYAFTITKSGNALNCTIGGQSIPQVTVNAALVNATKHGIMYRKLTGYTGTKHDSLQIVAP